MNYLLDTHIFIWWAGNNPRLKPELKSIISNPDNEIFISVVNAWEIVIKSSRGKLKLKKNVEDLFNRPEFLTLPVKINHILTLHNLPKIHSDPFDRLLVSQAKSENLTLLTVDPKIKAYFSTP